jgi:dihydrofolate synthase/folylpolyglutamate synthase
MQVIESVSQENNAPLINVAEEWHWELQGASIHGQTVQIRQDDAEPHSYNPPLLGPHQRVNLATALATVAALRAQTSRIPSSAIQRGIERVNWHARFEILAQPEPMSGGIIVGGNNYIVADGAHNRASAHELALTLKEVFPNSRVQFIFGASADKDIQGMLEELLPRAAAFILTQTRNARATSPDALARVAAPFLIPIHIESTLLAALLRARNLAAPTDIICITGSLFMAAEAREITLRERELSVESDLT